MSVLTVRADRLIPRDAILRGRKRMVVLHAIPNLLRNGYTEVRYHLHGGKQTFTTFIKNDKPTKVERA